MFPPEFTARIGNQPCIDAGSLMEALGRPAVTSVRVNRLKWPQKITVYEQVEWEPDGYYLPGRPLFTADPLFHAGVYYPQESSSMFMGEMFRQLTAGMNGLRVLDLCGAPGGKSTHLALMLGDDSLLVANEVIRSRASVLAENITKWGTGNAIVTSADPSRFALLPGFFDVIVADVPCSGEGMFRNPAAVAEWSLQNARICSERQRRIVMESWSALRPGGMLIYSTCTFNPAENEENISWVREKTGAVPLNVDLPQGSPVERIRYSGVAGYGFHPGRVKGDGFFIAALRKPGAADGHHGSSGYEAVRSPEIRIRKSATVRPSSRAFDLSESLASFDRSRVVMKEGKIIALAAEAGLYSYIEKNLPVIKSGTMIGEMKNGILIPAHDLAMSVKIREESWPGHTLTLKESLLYLRLEPPDASRMMAGRVLMKYRGVPLGFANNLGNRVNNGYPRPWRIRMESAGETGEIL